MRYLRNFHDMRDGATEGQTDGWTDGRTDGQTDGKWKPEKFILCGIIGHWPLWDRYPTTSTVH